MRFCAFLTAVLLCFSPVAVFAKGKKVAQIVLDAGHGGDKPGARGKISYEKDIALAVTFKLGKILKDSLRDRKLIYTRTTDVDVPLAERHEIANRAKADLFISVHVNSSPGRRKRVPAGYRYVKKNGKTYKQRRYKYVYDNNTDANGTECYVLGLHRNSQKENAIGEYSDNVAEEPGLMDENDPQTAIIIAQYSQAFLESSVLLGTKIQQAFTGQGRLDRGVKQKGLEVLAGCVMPGVLVEIGFINNEDEEKYLNSPQGQTEVAMAIYRGIKEYIREVER